MTKKSLDRQNRFRSKTYGFRLSPEENEVLERNVLNIEYMLLKDTIHEYIKH